MAGIKFCEATGALYIVFCIFVNTKNDIQGIFYFV